VRRISQTAVVGFVAGCVGLPMLGMVLAGRSLAPRWRFPPPLEIPRDYPRFSWIAVAGVLGAGALVAGSWIRSGARRGNLDGADASRSPKAHPQPPGARRFPKWGWAALGWISLWWWLAWTRQAWFAWGQRYTFTPLWLGLILAANALALRGGANVWMRRAPAAWGGLFAASAAFWWIFEWLNRFVQNWHYLGVTGVGPIEYALHASICFSTVLPAVAGMREWLGTWPGLQARLARGPTWAWVVRRETGLILCAGGAAGLVLTGAQPRYFYPALWLAPLLIGVGGCVLHRTDGWWRGMAAGDWREAGSWALAALACGILWELWNWHSLAKWVYTVPFVERWRVFEMPLLGYTGYLTFGLECALAAKLVPGRLSAGPALPNCPEAPQAGAPPQ
jgi:hypothetical protein